MPENPTMNPNTAERRNKVLLVEDHPLFRERLGQLINRDLGMVVCGETDNIEEALELVRTCSPDIAIVDISLRGSSGLELIKNLKAQRLSLPVLVLSMHDEDLYAERVLRAGARGYVTKNEASTVVITAIRTVLAGEVYVSKSVTARILERVSGGRADEGLVPGIAALADRELEVFQLIGRGRTVKEIADLLHLGESTVDTYRARIKEKLGLRSAAEVCLRAGQWVEEQGIE